MSLVPEGHDAVDLGAYALGLLDQGRGRAVQRHIDECAPCRREWEGLREMADLLGEMPPEVFLDGPPEGGDLVLARTVRQVRGEVSRRRRRRVLGIAAAAVVVVAAVLGGGVALGRATAGPAPVAGTVTLAATGTSGAMMHAAISPAADWVRLDVTVSGVQKGRHCKLVVVRKDGRREVAGSWAVGPKGEAGLTIEGSADVPAADVAALSVEDADGEVYVSAVT